MLEGKNICKSYQNRAQKRSVTILDNCSIKLMRGEILGLMGESGCGKSTLARILLRLIDCEQGSICFDGRDVTKLAGAQLKDFRQNVQFIAQRPEGFFDPMMRLGKSLVEPLEIFSLPIVKTELEQVLELVKLNTALLDRYPHQVSGGEIQRLSIARALLLKPKVLVLDEPTSMLDISVQAQILHLLKDIQIEQRLSYLFISHDKAVVDWLCDRSLVMKNGVVQY